MTQKETVRQCLENGDKLTHAIATTAYSIPRLAHYIYLLKKEGMPIKKRTKTNLKNRRYAEYYLEV